VTRDILPPNLRSGNNTPVDEQKPKHAQLAEDNQHAHLHIGETEQDIKPKVRAKTFMDRPVVAQRLFDDEAAARFLAFYAKTGRKMDAALASGVSYSVVRHWEVNDELFGELVEEAKQEWLNNLEREAYRRAVEGTLEPVVAGKDPEIVTYIRKYSDRLLEMLLKKADPSGYGNKVDVNANFNGGVVVAPAPLTIEATALEIEDVEDDE
jgi:hypothetical protein